MRSAAGPAWRISHDLPYSVNFVFWVRRQAGEPLPFPESVWTEWLGETVDLRPLELQGMLTLAVHPELKRLCAQEWPAFVSEWNRRKPELARRLNRAVFDARVHELMRDSDQQFTFLHTDQPGDLCLRIGDAWVLGEAYLDAEPLRNLVARLRRER